MKYKLLKPYSKDSRPLRLIYLDGWMNKHLVNKFDFKLYEFIKKVSNGELVFNDIDPKEYYSYKLVGSEEKIEKRLKKIKDILSGNKPLKTDFYGLDCVKMAVLYKYPFKKDYYKELEKLAFYNKKEVAELLAIYYYIVYLISEQEFQKESIEEAVNNVVKKYNMKILGFDKPYRLYLPIKWLEKIDKKERQIQDAKSYFNIARSINMYEENLSKKRFDNKESNNLVEKMVKGYEEGLRQSIKEEKLEKQYSEEKIRKEVKKYEEHLRGGRG